MLPSLIRFNFPGIPGVDCLFTTRAFGNISLSMQEDREGTMRRRARLAREIGAGAFAEAKQVHGTQIIFEPSPQDPSEDASVEADGLATSSPGLALMIKTADCQPILMAHESGRHILAIHAGWRGNRQDFPFLATARFCERYALSPHDLWAVRGPSLGPSSAQFTRFKEEWGADFLPWFDLKEQTMDLWSLTRNQLMRAGIPQEHIFGIDRCTLDEHDLFFSYRDARKSGCPDGRQASLIAMRQK